MQCQQHTSVFVSGPIVLGLQGLSVHSEPELEPEPDWTGSANVVWGGIIGLLCL